MTLKHPTKGKPPEKHENRAYKYKKLCAINYLKQYISRRKSCVLDRPRTVFHTYTFQILATLKKYTHKPHTFFYVPLKTHITPFHTKNNF